MKIGWNLWKYWHLFLKVSTYWVLFILPFCSKNTSICQRKVYNISGSADESRNKVGTGQSLGSNSTFLTPSFSFVARHFKLKFTPGDRVYTVICLMQAQMVPYGLFALQIIWPFLCYSATVSPSVLEGKK